MATVGESKYLVFDAFDWAADEDAKPQSVMILQAGQIIEITKAMMSAEADVAAADTNYNTYYLQNNHDTANKNVIASLANGPAATGSAVANEGTAMSTPAADQKVVGSETTSKRLVFVSAKTGTGLALARLRVHVWYKVLAWKEAA